MSRLAFLCLPCPTTPLQASNAAHFYSCSSHHHSGLSAPCCPVPWQHSSDTPFLLPSDFYTFLNLSSTKGFPDLPSPGGGPFPPGLPAPFQVGGTATLVFDWITSRHLPCTYSIPLLRLDCRTKDHNTDIVLTLPEAGNLKTMVLSSSETSWLADSALPLVTRG